MLIFILRRLMQSLFVLLAVSLVVFFAVYAVGDPIELLVNAEASEADRLAMIKRLGLDLPIWQQYTSFLFRALQGDLGTSFVHGIPAIELIVQRIPATLELVLRGHHADHRHRHSAGADCGPRRTTSPPGAG